MLNEIYEQEVSSEKSYSIISKWNDCKEFINLVKNKKPLFLLVLGSTETALIPGISAAGRNIESIKQTPALDAEYMVLIKEKFHKELPISPSGIPSPVLITRPLVKNMDIEIKIIDAGSFVKPECEHISLNMGPGECLTTGKALGPVKTNFLFQKGEKFASTVKEYPYIVIGECVPGGTTTALSVLCALGIDAFNLVSGSSPESNHMVKNHTVRNALLNHSHLFSSIKKQPLKAVEYFGDPMQAFVCGFIKGAQKLNLPILLAGGTQMIALYYLSKLMHDRSLYDTVVGTTSWIVNDKNANIKKLTELTSCPLIASNVNFKESKFTGLKAYEEGHIKEGVGAGGMMLVGNFYKNLSCEKIVSYIEDEYA